MLIQKYFSTVLHITASLPLDAYLQHQLKAAGINQPLFDDTARQALYEKALAAIGSSGGFNQLRQQIMTLSDCSKRTAQLAIAQACQDGSILRQNGQYRLPL